MSLNLFAMQPKVAVVVLNYNTAALLERFLPSVLASTYGNLEIIVADNASSDDSLERMQKQFAQVRTIAMQENTGYAGGYNLALQTVEADYYILLNSDVEVPSNWIEPLVELAMRDPNIAAIQPKLLAARQKTHFEYAGAAGGYLDRLAYPFCRGRIFSELEQDLGQYDQAREVFWASGAALFIKADVFHELGGFDAAFFAHMEEIDLCWRIKNQGYEVWCQPQSMVYHVGGATLAEGSPRKYFLNFRNNLAMLTKNYSGWLLPTLLLRLFLDGLSAVKFVKEGRPSLILQIVKAHWNFFMHLPFWLKQRRRLKKAAKTKAMLYPKSIVVQHFIKGKKTFRDLDFGQ